jgi:hypothetical protein
MCFDFLYNFFLPETFLTPRRIERDIIKKCVMAFIQVQSARHSFFDFNENWIFSIDVRKLLKHQISWNSVQGELSCFMRTDVTKLKVAFPNFAKGPKNDLGSSQPSTET